MRHAGLVCAGAVFFSTLAASRRANCAGARSLQAQGWVGLLAVVVMHYVLN